MNIIDNNAVVSAEYRLLNACYLKPENTEAEGVSDDLFLRPQSKAVYATLRELYKAGGTIDRMRLYNAASAKDCFLTIDAIDAIIGLSEDKDVNVQEIVKHLKSAKKVAEISNKLDEIKEEINRNVEINDISKEKIRNAVFDVEDVLTSPENKGLMTFDKWISSYQDEFNERSKGKLYKFNDQLLDLMVTTGPEPGQGGLICASSGMGKSSYCLNVINNLINSNIPCLYFSLEMGKTDTFDRLVALRRQIPFKDLVNPTPDNFQNLQNIIEEEKQTLIGRNLFRFCEDPTMSLSDIASYVRKFKAETGVIYCIVVIDLLTMVTEFSSVRSNLSLANQIELAINKLNALAKENNFHYIGVVQLNRSVETDKIVSVSDIKKYRPTRASIKNSNAMLERARYVVSLFRPKFFADIALQDDPEAQEMEDIIEVGMLKQNNGSLRTYQALFDGETFKVTPILDEA